MPLWLLWRLTKILLVVLYSTTQRTDYRASVENIPRDMSWQDLKDHFRNEADVVFADIWQDRSGRTCGFVVLPPLQST
jgi:hypothetical protein